MCAKLHELNKMTKILKTRIEPFFFPIESPGSWLLKGGGYSQLSDIHNVKEFLTSLFFKSLHKWKGLSQCRWK